MDLRTVCFVYILYSHCLSSGGHWHLWKVYGGQFPLCVPCSHCVFWFPVGASSQPALFLGTLGCWPCFECPGADSQPMGCSREWNVWPEALQTTKKMFQINLAFPFPVKWREALQGDLDKLEGSTITKPVKFNKGKCWTLHLGWGNPGCTERLGNEILESSSVQRDLGIMVDGKLDTSQPSPGSWGGHPCPGCTRPNTASLCHSALHWGELTSSAGGSLSTTI